MLFRAVFWIGVVAVLMPRQSSHVSVSHGLSPGTVYAPARPAGDADAPDDFQETLLQRLAMVQADIRAAERARATQGG